MMTCCQSGIQQKTSSGCYQCLAWATWFTIRQRKKLPRKKNRQYKCECRFSRTVGRRRSSLNNASLGLCFFIACSFLFFCEFVVPLIITKAELCRRRLGFTMADLTAIIQKLLNKRFISCFFWDVFHSGPSIDRSAAETALDKPNINGLI